MTVRITVWAMCLFFGRPDVAPKLLDICHRESRCNPDIGVHERDSHLPVRASWRWQVSVGHLREWCQPYRRGWGTRGLFGLSAVSHHRYLPMCYQPEWLDWSAVSVWVAFWKYVTSCGRGGWCGR